jgi:hypothetical protein
MRGIGSSGSAFGGGALPVGEQRMTAVSSAYDPGTRQCAHGQRFA